MRALTVKITGIVQGVGFRPYVFRLATSLGLAGSVTNTVDGVRIEARGPEERVRDFLARLPAEAPPATVITGVAVEEAHASGDFPGRDVFTILESTTAGQRTVLVSPDLDTCPACLAELADPADRRHGYPYINCTDCGPRYSLVRDLPYDRATTAMAAFPMCPDCLTEYKDPASRRFHAEATCCPACGPRLRVVAGDGTELASDPIPFALAQLAAGKILAIKGLGGFHLALDATDCDAVARLRAAKGRPHKPLAVMSPDLVAVRRFANPGPEEEIWLSAKEKPVVLLARKTPFPLAANLAPGNATIGVMLPYTPLHHLLLAGGRFAALVMTSGNVSGDPIVRDNREALDKLRGMADFFLMHDREIVTRIDDSVLRVTASGAPILLRRARSFAPKPILLAEDCGTTLALGGALKNTFCLTRGREAFVSQHTGDLDLLDSQTHLRDLLAHLKHILHIEPDLVVHDQHPDYPTTRMALDMGLPAVAIQHHHAHAVSVMAEHGLAGPVIAVTLDGSGYGGDGTVWGGEVLVAEPHGFTRAAHLAYAAMPGGDQAVKHPWRMACGFLREAFGEEAETVAARLFPEQAGLIPTLYQMLGKAINAPRTSSCGRLFDAVAALTGLCPSTSFEGQAAIALESVHAAGEHEPYPFIMDMAAGSTQPIVMDTAPLLRAVARDLEQGAAACLISARFHATIARLFAVACREVRAASGLDRVVLSGGVFQNGILQELLEKNLLDYGFRVYRHRELPPNDGCLALGQAVAGRRLAERLTRGK